MHHSNGIGSCVVGWLKSRRHHDRRDEQLGRLAFQIQQRRFPSLVETDFGFQQLLSFSVQ